MCLISSIQQNFKPIWESLFFSKWVDIYIYSDDTFEFSSAIFSCAFPFAMHFFCFPPPPSPSPSGSSPGPLPLSLSPIVAQLCWGQRTGMVPESCLLLSPSCWALVSPREKVGAPWCLEVEANSWLWGSPHQGSLPGLCVWARRSRFGKASPSSEVIII